MDSPKTQSQSSVCTSLTHPEAKKKHCSSNEIMNMWNTLISPNYQDTDSCTLLYALYKETFSSSRGTLPTPAETDTKCNSRTLMIVTYMLCGVGGHTTLRLTTALFNCLGSGSLSLRLQRFYKLFVSDVHGCVYSWFWGFCARKYIHRILLKFHDGNFMITINDLGILLLTYIRNRNIYTIKITWNEARNGFEFKLLNSVFGPYANLYEVVDILCDQQYITSNHIVSPLSLSLYTMFSILDVMEKN
jgi:hypothetical protein